MSDAPKLHGWITPEYAVSMVSDLTAFLRENGYMVWTKWHWPTVYEYQNDPVFKKMVECHESDNMVKELARQLYPLWVYERTR